MELLESILLGILQGVTEFLPVSSSGHLVLAQELLGRNLDQGITFEIVVHFGSLFSIMIYFRRRIAEIISNLFKFVVAPSQMAGQWAGNYDARISVYIVLSMIPAGIAGFTLRDTIEGAFNSPVLVSGMLLVTGGVLYLNKFVQPGTGKVTPGKALVMGIAQMFAMIPGISRSGSTITTGVLLGMKREDVADFSFLMLLPVIAGAMLLEFVELAQTGLPSDASVSLLAAFTASLLSGYYSLKFLLKLFKQKGLHYFAYYCWSAGLLGIIYFGFK